MAGVVFEAGRIAKWIDLEIKILGEGGFLDKSREKFCGGESTGRLVSMDSSEKANADRVAAVWALESKSGQGIFFALHFEGSEKVRLYIRQNHQRSEKPPDGPAAIFDGQNRSKINHGFHG